MGSNGIRFGIIQSLARNLPVLYEERAPISLFDAQSSDKMIPEETIDEVITSFLRFKAICDQAGVAPGNVRLIATEATRIAENSEQFQARIFEATGWKTILLRKEEEALISAMGIVGMYSSFLIGLCERCRGSLFFCRVLRSSMWFGARLGWWISGIELSYSRLNHQQDRARF
jgi:exopolyphosphatase/pppGpp-phosphohydrolase